MTQAVDFQVLLPRAQDVGRIQHIQQSNEQAQQQSFAAHLAQDTEKAQRTVQNPPQAREARIRGEERKQRNFLQDRHNSHKKNRTSKDASGDNREQSERAEVGNHIDLKI